MMITQVIYAQTQTTLDTTNAVREYRAENLNDEFGSNIINAGDVNGDQIPDFIIGAATAPKNTLKGRAYLFTSTTLNVGIVDATARQSMISNGSSIYVGQYLTGNGDLNGDGKSDFGVIQPVQNNLFWYQGKSNLLPALDFNSHDVLYTATNSPDILFNKQQSPLHNISIEGDIDGDGFDDMVIGLDYASNSTVQLDGRVLLKFGSTDIFNPVKVDIDQLVPTDIDAVFLGTKEDEHSGHSVSIIPDINGDGRDELLIGSFNRSNSSGNPEGYRVYLFYGKPRSELITSANKQLSLNNADAIFNTKESNGSDGFGHRVIGLGDINNDGFGDFAISAPFASNQKGALYVYYGSQTKFTISNENQFAAKIIGMNSGDQLGINAVTNAGDTNGDGFNDILLSSHANTNFTGKAYLINGKATKFQGETTVENIANTIINGTQPNGYFGYAVAGIGDRNLNGIDEILIASNRRDIAASPNAGAVYEYELSSNIKPNVTGGASIQLKTLSGASVSTVQNHDLIQIQLSATDIDNSKANVVDAIATSNKSNHGTKIRLIETGENTGTYVGLLRIVRTRSSKKIAQLAANIGDTIHIKSSDNISINTTATVVNSLPTVTNFTTTQEFTGSDTRVYLNFVLTDLDINTCNVNSAADQIQYFKPNTQSWTNATILGSIGTLQSSETGVTHNQNFQPLYWDAGGDIGKSEANYRLRMKVHDGTNFQQTYTESPLFTLDFTAPAQPVISNSNLHYNYLVVVTGNAEPLSTVEIYKTNAQGSAANLVGTGNVSSSGSYSVGPILTSPTDNHLLAVAIDPFGNRSSSSDVIALSFGEVTKNKIAEISPGKSFHIHLQIPFEAIPTEAPVIFNHIPTHNLITQTSVSPQLYDYVYGFELGFENMPSLNVAKPITVSMTFPETIASPNYLTINRWDGNSWTSAGITINQRTSANIVFQTNHFSTFSILDLQDKVAPLIGEIKINNLPYIEGTYYSDDISITVPLLDTGSGISSWNIQLLSGGAVVTSNGQSNLTSNSITATFNTKLSDQTYQLNIKAADNSIFTTETTVTLNVSMNTAIFDAINAPNPYNPLQGSMMIGYQLSYIADSIQCELYGLNRQLIWQADASSVQLQPGYHRLYWDGKDGFGSIVQNGLYYGYCVADGKTGKIIENIKVLVVK